MFRQKGQITQENEMLPHKERNVSERNIFVRSASFVTVDPELAPLVSYVQQAVALVLPMGCVPVLATDAIRPGNAATFSA